MADLQIRYFRPAKLDDDIVIVTSCTDMGAASLRMHQRAFRNFGAGDELITEASLRVGFVAPDGRPCRQPAEWRAAYRTVLSEESQ